jgi:hypothetical protein
LRRHFRKIDGKMKPTIIFPEKNNGHHLGSRTYCWRYHLFLIHSSRLCSLLRGKIIQKSGENIQSNYSIIGHSASL